MTSSYPKIAQLKSLADFRQRLADLGCELPVDDEILAGSASPLSQPLRIGGFSIGNRWCIHPMEGWDAQPDGSPSSLTLRRWQRFGMSGAKLIWGGEAAAVQPDGRANPRQTLATPTNRAGLRQLLETLLDAHHQSFGSTDDLCVGLQLTHSGRFCRPHDHRLEPRIAYHHPLLDRKFGISPDNHAVVWPTVVWTDEALEELIENYVVSARLAAEVGFHFVDIKACHGYLLHEFLSAESRPGRYGGDFDGRTRLLRTIISRVRAEVPQLLIGVRLSIFDSWPYEPGVGDGGAESEASRIGRPMRLHTGEPLPMVFGARRDNPLEIDLTEPIELLRRLQSDGVSLVNLSCGSPYYNPHLQRPAIFPPSDGYLPPEDPLVGVVRQIQVARRCKASVPDLPMVGTAYTYLQEYLPQVAQAVVRAGWIDSVGLGRMVLSYPTLPADVLAGRPWRRKLVCRTFSDCTTAPRQSLVSGCYPLDDHYKRLPESAELKRLKGT